jgi:CIC family chloride channel protein
VLLIAGVTGAATGLVVAGFERLTSDVLLSGVRDATFPLRVVLPLIGLVAAAVILRVARVPSPSTADEYIRSFHDRGNALSLRPVIPRLLASIATLGAGAPLGYEGPSLYAGAAIGSVIQRRLRRFFTIQEAKVLLVAGAAAGVAAIFKAPVTGLVFALEVPYQADLARRMLLPAAISAASSYVVFAAIVGTAPILPVAGSPPFDLVDLGGAAAIGLVAGVFARLFVSLIRVAKALSTRGHPVVRALIAGVVLSGSVAACQLLSDGTLALGPGYQALRWALSPQRGLEAIFVLATLRVIGTAAAVAGGGAGGLFIPLVMQGALLGRFMGGLFDSSNPTLFPVVGMAAFLGAGYRVPLAAVVFVAEFTGRPGFVVPGLIAAVVAQLVMGRASVSPYQVAGRVGHLEHRLQLPIAAVLDADVQTVPPDGTIDELFWQHFIAAKQHSVVVVDGARYLGMARSESLAAIDREAWAETRVEEIMLSDVPIASTAWLLADAIRVMEEAGVDRLPVCDGEHFVGVINASDLVRLDEILDRTNPDLGQ